MQEYRDTNARIEQNRIETERLKKLSDEFNARVLEDQLAQKELPPTEAPKSLQTLTTEAQIAASKKLAQQKK